MKINSDVQQKAMNFPFDAAHIEQEEISAKIFNNNKKNEEKSINFSIFRRKICSFHSKNKKELKSETKVKGKMSNRSAKDKLNQDGKKIEESSIETTKI